MVSISINDNLRDWGNDMRRFTKKEQREYISNRAPELARSGKFSGWLSIEHHLRLVENMHEARHALDYKYIRENLDDLCREAQKNKEIS